MNSSWLIKSHIKSATLVTISHTSLHQIVKYYIQFMIANVNYKNIIFIQVHTYVKTHKLS